MRNTFLLIGNYGLATFATAVVSASHLLIQLAVLHSLGSAEFGLIAFLLTLIQFGSGLCNSVVAAPYTVAISAGSDDENSTACFFAVNAGLALLNGALAAAAAFWIGNTGWPVAICFALASALFTIRWFGRTDAYATHKPVRAAASDIAYSAALLMSLGLAWFQGLSLLSASMIFVAGGIAGMTPFGMAFLLRHVQGDWRSTISAYRPIWREQSRWAVVGLVTTEATANAHSYLVTLIAGPAAFAPIAAAMLFLRPIGVCMVSLTQIERPAMARAFAANNRARAFGYAMRFTAVLALIWVLTIAATAAILHFFPAIAFKPGLEVKLVLVAFGLWAIICLVQCVQTPLNVFLQAEGRFRELAEASMKACLVTVAGVVALLLAVGPVYATIGVLAGQLIMTFGIVTSVRAEKVPRGLREVANVSG
jgi:O-antigen/teichoic acid export membrane protein